jgi:hypothetical protein
MTAMFFVDKNDAGQLGRFRPFCWDSSSQIEIPGAQWTEEAGDCRTRFLPGF